MKQKFSRSSSDKFIAGVCGGLARSMGWDASVVRILTVVAALFFPWGVPIAYGVAWLVLPLEEGGRTGLDDLKSTFSNNSNNNPPSDYR